MQILMFYGICKLCFTQCYYGNPSYNESQQARLFLEFHLYIIGLDAAYWEKAQYFTLCLFIL